MTWQEGVAVVVIVAGLGAGAFLVAQRPAFWVEFGARLIKAMLPAITRVVTKRMPPDEEAEYRAAVRAGRGDEWIRRRMTRNRREK